MELAKVNFFGEGLGISFRAGRENIFVGTAFLGVLFFTISVFTGWLVATISDFFFGKFSV